MGFFHLKILKGVLLLYYFNLLAFADFNFQSFLISEILWAILKSHYSDRVVIAIVKCMCPGHLDLYSLISAGACVLNGQTLIEYWNVPHVLACTSGGAVCQAIIVIDLRLKVNWRRHRGGWGETTRLYGTAFITSRVFGGIKRLRAWHIQ